VSSLPFHPNDSPRFLPRWAPKVLKKWLLMGLNQVKVVETWLDLSDSHSLTAWGCRNGIRSIYGWTTAVLWCLAADALDATVKSLSCPRSAQVAYCHSAWLPRRLLLASKAVDVDAIEAEVAADATWWRYSLGNLALIGVLGAFRAAFVSMTNTERHQSRWLYKVTRLIYWLYLRSEWSLGS